MIRLVITLMISLCVGQSYGQSLVDFPTLIFPVFLENSFGVTTEVPSDTCVNIKGQLTSEVGEAITLDYVRVQIIDLDTEQVIKSNTEADGSFTHCVPCGHTFIVLAYPRDYYCDEVKFETKIADCQSGQTLELLLPLQPFQIQESEIEGSNMTSVEMDSISKLRAANKSFLESISVVEDLPPEETKTIEEAKETPVEYVAPPSPRIQTEIIEEDESFDQVENEDVEILVEDIKELPIEKEEKVEAASTVENITTAPKSVLKPSLNLTSIYYPFNSDDLDQNDKATLDELAMYLLEHPELRLNVSSYTDPRGTKAYNKWLAKKRAQKVIEYLLKNGVEQTRLIAKAEGEISEVANYADARRTDLEIMTTEESTVESGLGNNNTYLSNIYYDFDAYQLNAPSRADLQKVIDHLLSRPELTVEVRSHTDARGSSKYNQWLSQKRANEVVRKMVAAGVGEDRIKGIGLGEKELVNDCSDGVACNKTKHAENRRTEFVFL